MSLPIDCSGESPAPGQADVVRTAAARKCGETSFAMLRMFGCDKGILQIIGDIDEPMWSDDDFDMIARPRELMG